MTRRIPVSELTANRKPAPPTPSRANDGTLIPLTPSVMRPAEAMYATWHAVIPSQYSLADACEPDLWRKVELHIRDRGERKPKAGDFVRLVSAGGAFDAICTIEAVDRGYRLAFYCGRLPQPE